MNAKLRIERYFPDSRADHPDDSPASEQPAPSPQLLPSRSPASSVRPYFYRVPKGSPPPADEAPPDQRRSTDDQPTGPSIK